MEYTITKSKYTLDKLSQTVLSLVFISALFFPSFRLTSSFAIRLDDIILLGVSPFIFLLIISIRQELFRLDKYLFVYWFLIGCIIFSCLYGYLFLKVPFSSGDINEVFRLLKLFFIIVLISFVNRNTLKLKIDNIVFLGSIYIVCLGFVQYLNPLGIGDFLAKIYGEHHAFTMIDADSGQKRVILSGAGPNDGALIALLLYIYMVFTYLDKRSPKFLVLCFGLFACILFTSSRTTLLAACFITLIILLKYAHLIYKLLFAGIVVLAIFYILPYFQYIYIGFQMALEGTNTSLLKRFDKWEEAFDLFKQSKIFGWGIAKSIHITIVDSEYLLTLRRYGIVGFIALLSFIYFPIISNTKKSVMLKNITKYMALSSIFVMVTGNFFNSYQTITVYVMLVALSHGSYVLESENIKNPLLRNSRAI